MLVCRSRIHRETGAARLRKQRESPPAWGVRVLVLAMSREPDRRIGSKGRYGTRPSMHRAPAAGAASAENTKSRKPQNHDAALPGHPTHLASRSPVFSRPSRRRLCRSCSMALAHYLGELYRYHRRPSLSLETNSARPRSFVTLWNPGRQRELNSIRSLSGLFKESSHLAFHRVERTLIWKTNRRSRAAARGCAERGCAASAPPVPVLEAASAYLVSRAALRAFAS